jgi:NAD-dependent dihydropyrimidine dehydrogenase PreA subunit
VARAAGIAAVCRRHGVPLLDLGRGEAVTASGPTYRGLTLAREAVEARWLWNLPKWKTHTMMGLTLGIKNLYGCVPGKRKLAVHLRAGRDAAAFARQLLDLEQILSPRLTLLDGVVAMEGPGPSRGTPLARGLVLAATDAAALDWEATRLSGFAPGAVPTVAASVASGRLDPDRVQVRGDPAGPLAFRPAPGSPCDGPLTGPLQRWVKGWVAPLPRFAADRCTGCGVCVEACPAGALRPGTPPELVRELCLRCYCCQELCPQGAAQVPRRGGFGGSTGGESGVRR